MVKVYVLDKNKKRRFDPRAYPDKYLEFTLHKTNFDSMGAIGVLGKFISMRPNNFGIAGNKVIIGKEFSLIFSRIKEE